MAVEQAEAKTLTSLSSDRPVICTVMRVKDEEKYIGHALESLRPLGGEIVVLDDGSTDATADIIRDFGGVHYTRQDDLPMDEARDRTLIYHQALKLKSDWIFTLDGDEVLHRSTTEKMLRAAEFAPSEVNVFYMYMAVMATPPGVLPKKKRWYNGQEPLRFWSMTRMFRVRDAVGDYEFGSKHDNGLHCGCVPEMRERKCERLNGWIEYYGYESAEAVKLKYEFYSKHDKHNFPRVEKMWHERVKQGTTPFPLNPCCKQLSITRTVQY